MILETKTSPSRIIGAAIEVHRHLGPGFLESIYENALMVELRHRRIAFARQLAVPIVYQGVEVGLHRLDLFVEDQIVVELKAIKELTPTHFAIVRSYLNAVGRNHGLILNFTMPKLDIKRVLASPSPDRI